MKKLQYILIAFLSIFLMACEEDVVLDLGDIEKRLVVEASITNQQPAAMVSLSYSQGFYDAPEYNLLDNATVKIISPDGANDETLSLTSSGKYVSKQLNAVLGETYTLQVELEGQKIEVDAKLPQLMEIRDVTFIPSSFYDVPDSLNAFVNIIDRKDEDNYFRMFVRKPGEDTTGEFFVTDDSFGKDAVITLPVYYKNYTYGDTVVVELRHLNQETYDYYNGLTENLGGSFNSIAPGNPVSNMPDDVFGYFAGYTVDIDTIIISAGFPMF